MKDATTGQQAAAILGGLGWPAGIHTERLAASVYDRAMRSGMFEADVIIGYTFNRTELPAVVSRDDRLAVAMYALLRFAADSGRLEALRHDGRLVPDGTLRSGRWTAASSRLPGMCGLYGTAGRERNGAKAEPTAG